MLPLFNDITRDLSDNEKRLIPLFVKGLKTKLGRDNAVSNTQIRVTLERKGVKVNDVQVRKIVSFISNNSLVPGLIACSKGYYVTHDSHELSRYLKSLEGRNNEINKRIEATRAHLKEVMYRKQTIMDLNQ